MVKLFTIVIAMLFLAGCQTTKVRVEYRDVVKPVLSCPAPPEIKRPHLPIDDLTDEDKKNPDKVAKAYKASIKLLQGYGIRLESIMAKYKTISEKNKALVKRVDELFPEKEPAK